MSVLFNHARRYDLYDRNPIKWVRQSAKRRIAPDVLTCNEVRQLLAALEPRDRIMVLLDVATGLRQANCLRSSGRTSTSRISNSGSFDRSCNRLSESARQRLHKNLRRSTVNVRGTTRLMSANAIIRPLQP